VIQIYLYFTLFYYTIPHRAALIISIFQTNITELLLSTAVKEQYIL